MSTLSQFNQDWESLKAIITQEQTDQVKAIKTSMDQLDGNEFPQNWTPYQITQMKRATEDLIKIMDEIQLYGPYPES